MSPIHTLLNKINSSSNKILAELEVDNPSFSLINNELKVREEFVKELGQFVDSYSASSFAAHELEDLKNRFEAFTKLNVDIQSRAEQLFTLQQEKLMKAKIKRKAEELYKISLKPEISYHLQSEI